MMNQLVEAWRQFKPEYPYIFPGDESIIPENKTVLYRSLKEYVASPNFGIKNDRQLHLGLLPVPYIGNLETASVFILTLNPGFGPLDYFSETDPGFKEALYNSIYQSTLDKHFPFLGLNPEFAWHGGFSYWRGKLQSIAERIVQSTGVTYLEALQKLSQTVATLELVPYHSASFGGGSLIKKLLSTQLMLNYVHDVLEPRAQQGDIRLIVVRKSLAWGLEEHENCTVYTGPEARGGHLSINSRGGKAILKALGL